jgi:hypothetical protein
MRIRLPLASRLRKRALERLRHAIEGRRNRLPESAVDKGPSPLTIGNRWALLGRPEGRRPQ